MRVLRDMQSIKAEIDSCPDPHVHDLLVRHVEFVDGYDYDDGTEPLTVILIDPGDTIESLDARLAGQFLTNHYSGTTFGDPGFVPCFETLEEHPTFFEMLFVESDSATAVIVPKSEAIDPRLLAICAQHATRPQVASS